ncbi:helix-turn-helix domain-containing protein [Streptomyces sp. NPDC058286]|uniref:helix-turn-helix domain-containing protein n=1 Tax=Streptomyces sp. NPDC058286 TaxID=3346422 RepID=UPI0036E64E7F
MFKAVQMRQLLAQAGLRVSAGKMSALWSGTPVSVRLDDLQVLCRVLGCDAAALLVADPPGPAPDDVAWGREAAAAPAGSAEAGAPAPASAARLAGSGEGARAGAAVRPSLPPV